MGGFFVRVGFVTTAALLPRLPFNLSERLSLIRFFVFLLPPPQQALVGNLPYSVYENQIADLFAPCGGVDDIYLVRDRETGDPKVTVVYIHQYHVFCSDIYSVNTAVILARPQRAVVTVMVFFARRW